MDLLLVTSAACAATPNLVANPGFEGGSTGWNLAASQTGPGRVSVAADAPHIYAPQQTAVEGLRGVHYLYPVMDGGVGICNLERFRLVAPR